MTSLQQIREASRGKCLSHNMVNIGFLEFGRASYTLEGKKFLGTRCVTFSSGRRNGDGRACEPTELVMLAYCRARQAEDGQNADDSLYFMVLDVIEEPGGRFNIMGKTEGEQSILVQIHDFEPYFYIGQPVFKARPQAQAL